MGKHPAWLGKAMQTGGRADWQGEGDSGKALKEKSAADRSASKKEAVGSGAVTGLGVAGMLGARSRIGKLIGAGATALGARATKDAFAKGRDATEANRAGDEAEGRKRGGRASKKKD